MQSTIKYLASVVLSAVPEPDLGLHPIDCRADTGQDGKFSEREKHPKGTSLLPRMKTRTPRASQ